MDKKQLNEKNINLQEVFKNQGRVIGGKVNIRRQ